MMRLNRFPWTCTEKTEVRLAVALLARDSKEINSGGYQCKVLNSLLKE